MNDTTARSEQYRGFTISVTPQKDNDDLWDFTYHLQREAGAGGEAKDIERSRTWAVMPRPRPPAWPAWKWPRRKWTICCVPDAPI